MNSLCLYSDRLTYKLSDSLCLENVNIEIMQGKRLCVSALFTIIIAFNTDEQTNSLIS